MEGRNERKGRRTEGRGGEAEGKGREISPPNTAISKIGAYAFSSHALHVSSRFTVLYKNKKAVLSQR